MIKRIGLLTSGGDCQALNATMRGVVKGLQIVQMTWKYTALMMDIRD